MEKQYKPLGYRIRTALLVAFGLCAFSQTGAAQDQKVTLSSRSITIEKAFGEIQQQTGLVIAVNHATFNTDRRVTLSNSGGTAREVLTSLLAGTGQTFELSNNYVILRPAPTQKQPAQKEPAASERKQAAQPAAESAPEPMAAPAPAAAETGEAPAAAHREVWQTMPAVDGAPQPEGFRKQRLPLISIKTNLIDDAMTSINLGFEIRLADQWTLHLPVSYNPWKFSGNRQWRHLSFAPEGRFWLGEAFNGHFFGITGLYSYFNAGNIDMPLGIFPGLKDYRYEGNLYGAGFSYGYQWILGKRWGMEATIGMGYLYADYKQYDCAACGEEIGKGTKHYFGPTKLGLSLILFIK